MTQKEVAQRLTSPLWIVHGLGSGLCFALGNVAFGISCSQRGIYGAGFPGPATLLITGLYRLGTLYNTKKRTGKWVDKENSNYWVATQND